MHELHLRPALLLQLLLSELIKSHKRILKNDFSLASPLHLSPFDWTDPPKPLTKMGAYSQNLKTVFPKQKKDVNQFTTLILNALFMCYKDQHKTLNHTKHQDKYAKKLQSLCKALEPLIATCKGDENLFLFLLKHKEDVDLLMHSDYLYAFLASLYPEGLEEVGEKMCDQYHQRGFFSQIAEYKLLLTQLCHERTSTSTCEGLAPLS